MVLQQYMSTLLHLYSVIADQTLLGDTQCTLKQNCSGIEHQTNNITMLATVAATSMRAPTKGTRAHDGVLPQGVHASSHMQNAARGL